MLAVFTLGYRSLCGESTGNSSSWIEEEYRLVSQLSRNPKNVAAHTELGLLYAEKNEHVLARKHLKSAVIYGNWSNVTVLANYALELTHMSREEAVAAVAMLQLAESLFHPNNPSLVYILGLIHLRGGNVSACHGYYQQVVALIPPPPSDFYRFIITSFNDVKLYPEAGDYITRAIQTYPKDARLLFVCGLNFHYQSKYDLALELYRLSGELDPSFNTVYINIAGVYQMLGRLKEAKAFYEHVYDRLRHDSAYLNNYGSLLLAMNEYEEGEKLLKASIESNPEQEHAQVNLAGYYQDEGLLLDAESLLLQAIEWSSSALQLELRVATLLSPVAPSWIQMMRERRRLMILIRELHDRPDPDDDDVKPLMSGLDRIHFYIQYHGYNDRKIQELMAHNYRKIIRNVGLISPHLPSHQEVRSVNPTARPRKELIRIGFMSKLFGVFEPHGMLLDGVVRFLPRDRFRVIALEVAAGGAQKVLSPLIAESADELVEVSLDHIHAGQTLAALQLDILVFADVLSEPMNHFLLHSRFAIVQIAFWGNPITSGSQHVDYFMSADIMEHPYRTRVATEDEPYSEQVVLTPGQGIWYYHPQSAEIKQCEDSVANRVSIGDDRHALTREEFGLDPEWFVFLCPQSVFKLHPLFDEVVAAILQKSPEAHVVFTAGRRPRWTHTFARRLQQSIDAEDIPRCHIVERVSSERFIDFIKIADVLLHPFPFDGSRTSADSIAAGIPYVTLPTEYLRGRMGASFLRTMNIPELVARSITEYVDIAVRLSVDEHFFAMIKDAVEKRSWLIWEDMEVPFAWTKFLSSSVGDSYPLSYEEFIKSCGGRNVTHDLMATAQREVNQQLFDMKWGQPQWMLDARGVAVLESDAKEVNGELLRPRMFDLSDNIWGDS